MSAKITYTSQSGNTIIEFYVKILNHYPGKIFSTRGEYFYNTPLFMKIIKNDNKNSLSEFKRTHGVSEFQCRFGLSKWENLNKLKINKIYPIPFWAYNFCNIPHSPMLTPGYLEFKKFVGCPLTKKCHICKEIEFYDISEEEFKILTNLPEWESFDVKLDTHRIKERCINECGRGDLEEYNKDSILYVTFTINKEGRKRINNMYK